MQNEMKLITSYHAVEEALRTRSAQNLYISRHSSRSDYLKTLAKECNVPVTYAKETPEELKNEKKFRGYWISVYPKYNVVPDFDAMVEKWEEKDQSVLLVLDGIQDVHNLGAILRSADLFAVDGVIIPQRRSAGLTETVERISSGASRYVPVFDVPNVSRSLDLLKEKGFWLYGADMSGQNVSTVRLDGKIVIIMGNEEKGLSQLIRGKCDFLIKIPVKGHIDSLNVSVAAGILLYEARRQTGLK